MSEGRKIFLCGPITYLIGPLGFDQRMRELVETVARALTAAGHDVLSAHRLEGFGANIPADPAEVYVRDWAIAQHAEVFVFLFPSDKERRLVRTDGTFIELGWATALGKPIMVVTDTRAAARSYLFEGLLSHGVPRGLFDLADGDCVDELVHAILRLDAPTPDPGSALAGGDSGHRPGRGRDRPLATSSDGLHYHTTPIGNYYLPDHAPDDIVVQSMQAGAVFELEVVEVARRFIRPGSAVIDAGANFGQMALLFGEAAGPEGLVYALEAQRWIHDVLVRNIGANHAQNVVPIFAAIFNESGRQFRFPRPDLVRFGAYGSYNLPLASAVGDPVESLKIDDLDIDRPVSFMKVDLQGCDLFAMQGAITTIERHRMPILFEFEEEFQAEYGTNFQAYLDFVASIDYRFSQTVLGKNYLIEPRN